MPDTPPLTFSFSLTPEDYARAVPLYYGRRKSFWITLGAIVLILVLMVLLIRLGRWYGNDWTLLLYIALMAVSATLGILFLYVPRQLRRQAERHPQMTALTTWTLDEECIHVVSGFGESRFVWETFGDYLENGDYFLLLYAHNKRLFQILPKRAIHRPEDQVALRALLDRRLKQKP